MRMPKKGRRPARSSVLRRWLAVGALVLFALLYYRPLKAYVDARSELGAPQPGRPPAPGRQGAARAAARRRRPRSRRCRARRARSATCGKGEHLFIVKGIQQWRAARTGQHDGPPCTLTDPRRTDRAVVARQIGREPRAFRRVVVRCPFGRPAVTEQSPYDPTRRAVPDDVLRDLPPPRRRDLAARGGGGVERWTRARRTTTRSSPRASPRRTRSHAPSAASSPAARPAATAARRSTSASAAPARHGLAQVPARPRGLRARAARLRARRAASSPSSSRCGRTAAASTDVTSTVAAGVRRRIDPHPPGVGGRQPPARGRAERPAPLPNARARSSSS